MSPSGAATAGVLTHLSCLSNLAGLNAIVGSATDILDGVLQVLVYNVIWFSRAIVALVIQRPPGGVRGGPNDHHWMRRHRLPWSVRTRHGRMRPKSALSRFARRS